MIGDADLMDEDEELAGEAMTGDVASEPVIDDEPDDEDDVVTIDAEFRLSLRCSATGAIFFLIVEVNRALDAKFDELLVRLAASSSSCKTSNHSSKTFWFSARKR